MALIHYQFEKIDPFFDGNSRVGIIINILYLVLTKKIEYPILYLSRYFLNNKDEYYQLLNDAETDDNKLLEFVGYMLDAVIFTSQFTIDFINQVNESFEKTRSMMEELTLKIYKLEIVEQLYYDIYTKDEHFREVLGISKNTSTKYLKELERLGFLSSQNVGK